jgi:hypothetical protein
MVFLLHIHAHCRRSMNKPWIILSAYATQPMSSDTLVLKGKRDRVYAWTQQFRLPFIMADLAVFITTNLATAALITKPASCRKQLWTPAIVLLLRVISSLVTNWVHRHLSILEGVIIHPNLDWCIFQIWVCFCTNNTSARTNNEDLQSELPVRNLMWQSSVKEDEVVRTQTWSYYTRQ